MGTALHLTELISTDILLKMQDSFTKMTGISAVITDEEGTAITQDSSFSDFCNQYPRSSPFGLERCNQCARQGSKIALEIGNSVTYPCHAGLIDFAAPIMSGDTQIGCFIGGQVLTEPPNKRKVYQAAENMGIEPEDYWNALCQVRIVPEDEIQKAAEFLYTMAKTLSSIASHNHKTLVANSRIERSTNLKSEFLANMSHEIRTPMNAVIGMAEMALREKLTPTAHNYVNQIKNSGKNLLAIINDILDYSKIESGKMEINFSEYDPIELIHDIAGNMMSHMNTKNIQLILDIDPNLPYELLGDSLRIKQIMMNLTSNAVKFTKNGYIIFKIGCSTDPNNSNQIIMKGSVQDTGIGIRKADMEKLFLSFQQVDSKRNRNLEGTGLGLAISQDLLQLMMGSIQVESDYGKGSKFSFELPQLVTRDKPSISIQEQYLPVHAACRIADPMVLRQMRKDLSRLGASYIVLDSDDGIQNLAKRGIDYLLIDEELFTPETEEYAKAHPELNVVLIINYTDTYQATLPNMQVIKKPVYVMTLAAIFNHEDIYLKYTNPTDDGNDFIAPDANVLIVDDNAVNLTVAVGLLKPLKMHTDTAQSGIDALDKITKKKYDLIFMDHQMPEMDGIETTHIIRLEHEDYAAIPIIAFSADSSTEAMMMFLNEGLNDYVAKPIELRMMIAKLKRWLPKEKIQYLSESDIAQANAAPASASTSNDSLQIEGLNTAAALKLLGSQDLYWEVLKDYYHSIHKKADLIRELLEKEDWKNYTIEVHALKSASRQIGAIALSELAAEMEQAGNEQNIERIQAMTAPMLEQYLDYARILEPYFPAIQASEEPKEAVTEEQLQQSFAKLRSGIEELDMDIFDEVIEELSKYEFADWQQELFEQLKNAVEEMDVDACETIMQTWENHE